MRLVRLNRSPAAPRHPALPVLVSLFAIAIVTLSFMAADLPRHGEDGREPELPIAPYDPSVKLGPRSRVLRVRLEADAAGDLEGIFLGPRSYAPDDAGLNLLNLTVRQTLGTPTRARSWDWKIEVDPDPGLRLQELARVLDACCGKLQVGPNGEPLAVHFVDAVRLSPPRA